EFGHVPSLLFAVHSVHAHQHFSPILALSSPSPGIDLQDRRQFILWLIEGALEFCFFNLLHGPLICLLYFLLTSLSGLPEIKEYCKVLNGSFHLLIEFNPILIELDVLQNLCGPLVVVPESRT